MRLSTLVKLALALALVLVVAMIAAAKSIDLERYKASIAEWVRAETGRTLTVAGPLRLRLGLVPTLIAEGVTLGNVAGGSRPEMIRIDKIEAEIALPALLRKEILVQRLVVSSPDIVLERGNWRWPRGEAPAAVSGPPTRFGLRELKIKNARLSWRQGEGSAGLHALNVHKLTLLPEQGGAALAVNVVGDSGGKMFGLAGKVGTLGAALAGKPWPLSLKATAPDSVASIEGVVADLSALRGIDIKVALQADDMALPLTLAGIGGSGPLGPLRLSGRLNDAAGPLGVAELEATGGRRDNFLVSIKGAIRDLIALSGIEATVQVEALSLSHLDRLTGAGLPAWGPLHATAQVRDGRDGWSLDDIKATLGGSDLAGAAHLSPGERMHVRVHLTAGHLDLTEIGRTGPPAATGDRLIPDLAVPVAALRGFDAEAALRADSLRLPGLILGQVQATAKLDKGLLNLPTLRAGAGGGTIDGSLVLDARPGHAPQASVRLKAGGIETGALLREAGSALLSGGNATLSLALKGQGTSLRALAADAQGSVLLSLGPAQIYNDAFAWAGADLASQMLTALNPLAAARPGTALSCAVAHFRLKDGVAVTDRGVAVQAEGVDVVGSGTLDLRDETVDLGFVSRARGGLGLSLAGSLGGVTRLRGTVLHPTLAVDERGAARAALSVGAAAATGGLSLLGEAVMERITADANPCRTALAMGPAATGGGGLLEGLFGR